MRDWYYNGLLILFYLANFVCNCKSQTMSLSSNLYMTFCLTSIPVFQNIPLGKMSICYLNNSTVKNSKYNQDVSIRK